MAYRTIQPQEDASRWPLADEPNASMSAAVSSNASDLSASLYYRSKGALVEVKWSNYTTWLPYKEIVAATNNTNNTKTTSSKDALRIKIAAAVTASVITIAVLACIIGWRFYRREHKNNSSDMDPKQTQESDEVNEFGYTGGKAELHGDSDLKELDHDPECQLLHQLQSHRHFELRAAIPAELDGLCRCELDAPARYELATSEASTHMEGKQSSESSSSTQGSERDESDDKEVPHWAWEILRREKQERERGLTVNTDEIRSQVDYIVSPI